MPEGESASREIQQESENSVMKRAVEKGVTVADRQQKKNICHHGPQRGRANPGTRANT